MVTIIGGNHFPLTEGAELEMSPNIKIAPFMDLETGLYGYIDIEGQTVIEPRYQYAESFSEGVAVVAESGSKGTYYGYIDRKGDIILPLKYEYARGFHEGLALVSYNGDLLVINKSGDVSYKVPENMIVGDYNCGLAPIYPSADQAELIIDSSGYVDRKGEMVFNYPTIKGMPFNEGFAQVMVRDDGQKLWGYLDQDGNVSIEPRFVSSEPFSEGVAAVAIRDENGNKKWGYIDPTGKFVIEPTFDSAFSFKENLAVVYLDDYGYGYIDRSGKIVIEPVYKMATSFCNGYANVRKSSTDFCCIDKTGQTIFEVTNKLIFDFK